MLQWRFYQIILIAVLYLFSQSAISVPQPTAKNISTTKTISHCSKNTSSHYKKRIAAVFFPLQFPQHVGVVDYFGFEQGIGPALLQQLNQSGLFISQQAHDINLYSDLSRAPYISDVNSADDQSLLSSIEKKLGVQYVISGIIRDLSYTPASKGFFDNFVRLNKQPKQPEQRNLVIDFYLHDTLTEQLISQKRYSYQINNSQVLPLKATAFGTQEFYNSAYGKLFTKVIKKESELIQKTLACRPFTMKILDQRDKFIYLDAGSNSNVKVGDVLTMHYADKEAQSFNTKSNKKQFGWPKDQLKITKVFPFYSIATSPHKQVIHLEKNQEYILVW